jgi:hypothetical protein
MSTGWPLTASPCPRLDAEVILGHYIADADPASWAEHPEHLGDHLWLVDRQVDYAVGDHYIYRFIR